MFLAGGLQAFGGATAAGLPPDASSTLYIEARVFWAAQGAAFGVNPPRSSNNAAQARAPLTRPPNHANNTTQGVPLDATEREMSHIFRPFPGFQSIRLCTKQGREAKDYVL